MGETMKTSDFPYQEPTYTDDFFKQTHTDIKWPTENIVNPQPEPPPLHERPMIYVAGYYSANPVHGTIAAVKAYEELLAAGWCPVVPHVSMVLDMLSPAPPEFWYAYDLALLKRCDAMYVRDDERTKDSTGVKDEIAFCSRYDIPVFHTVVDANERFDY